MSREGFMELEVWHDAKNLAVNIYKMTIEGELSKDFGLKDQIRRAAVSIPSNIAEGDERYTNKETIRFFYIAKGSLAELQTQLIIANEIGYINDKQLSDLVENCNFIGRKLGALIKARQKIL